MSTQPEKATVQPNEIDYRVTEWPKWAQGLFWLLFYADYLPRLVSAHLSNINVDWQDEDYVSTLSDKGGRADAIYTYMLKLMGKQASGSPSLIESGK